MQTRLRHTASWRSKESLHKSFAWGINVSLLFGEYLSVMFSFLRMLSGRVMILASEDERSINQVEMS